MRNLSEQLIKDLIDQGVNTFFGVQGGACARLIENIIKFKGKYVPVLNEQSAGYYAHGHYMATKKTAGLIFTTGPGITNGMSGIASCYYDRVPLVTLVGQVSTSLNIAKKTKTRMVGFQEVPHLDLCKPISDYCYKINKLDSYLLKRNQLLENLNSKVQVVNITNQNELKNYFKQNLSRKEILELLKKSRNPVLILGAGFAHSKNYFKSLVDLKKLNIKISCTWGGQKVQSLLSKKDNFIGFGTKNFEQIGTGDIGGLSKEEEFLLEDILNSSDTK